MSKNEIREGHFNTEEELHNEDYFLDDEIDKADEDYFLDDEEETDSEDYWLDDEEDSDEGTDKDSEDYWLDDEEDSDSDEGTDKDSEDYWLDDEEDSEENAYKDSENGRSYKKEEGQEHPDRQKDTAEDTFEEESEEEVFEEEDFDDEDEEDKEFMSKANEKPSKKQKKKQPQKKPDKQGKENKTNKQKKKGGLKKALIISGSVIGVLVVAYIGISVFFMSHFYINTTINGHSFSAKTVEEVENYMAKEVEGYVLTIQEKENRTDEIWGEDISLVYEKNKDIENALKNQNAFLWPKAFFQSSATDITVNVSYDETALDKMINNLQAVKIEQTPPTSAYPKFDGEQFVVEPEVTGNAVDMDNLNEKVIQYITEFKTELNMEEEGCYALPEYTSDSKEVKAACDEMNKYLQASITYSMSEPIVVDKAIISNWVTADENMQVTFNEEAVRQWLSEFGDRFDTVGTTRTITTPWGKEAQVSGGTYGWGIDEDTEFAALVNSIKNGEVVAKEPAYYPGQVASSHGPQDWGSTYAEVDLSAQHMWYIVDGAVALETDVVTGVPGGDKETTSGVWSILEMELNKTLVGETDPATGEPEYRTPVSFWMRITWTGIGFHDATWQAAFGGSLNAQGYGSHGCVNMPYDMAGALYNMISVGTPVIVHY